MKKPFFSPDLALPLILVQLFSLAFGLLAPLAAGLCLTLPLREAALLLAVCTLGYGLLSLFPRLQFLAFPAVFALMCLAVRPCLTDAEAFRAAFTAALSDGPAAFAAWERPLSLLLCLFVFSCTLSAVQSQRPLVPALLLSVTEVAVLALLPAAPALPALLPLAAGLALCACPRDKYWLRALVPVCLSLLLLLPFLPYAGTRLPAIARGAERLTQTARDYLFYTEPRLPFSLTAAGWQPLGAGQLGGTAAPGDDPVLEVRAAGPALLRGAVHSVYTGRAFEDPQPGSRYLLADPRFAPLRRDLFDPDLPSGGLMQQLPAEEEFAVSLLSDAASTLFVTQRFSALRSDGLVPYHSDTGELFATRSLVQGDAYAFRGRRMTGDTPGIGRIVEAAAGTADAPDLSAFLQLPEGVEAGVRSLALEAAGDSGSGFERAWRLCAWLRETYPYTLTQNAPPQNRDFVSWFLLSERRGYCTSFAAAMVVMARTLGLPARYIEGYSVRPDAQGVARVTQREAHAWAEVYFPGFGWLPFDPTPADRQQDASASPAPGGFSFEPATPSPAPDATASPVPLDTPEQTPAASPQTGGTATPPPVGGSVPGAPPSGTGRSPGRLILPAALLLLLLALCVLRVVFTAPARGAARLSPTGAVLLWYRSCLQLLECLGIPPQPGEAPAAFLQRAEDALSGRPKLSHLGAMVNRARYGNVRLTAEDAAKAAEIHRALWSRLTIRQRLKWIKIRFIRGPIPLAD